MKLLIITAVITGVLYVGNWWSQHLYELDAVKNIDVKSVALTVLLVLTIMTFLSYVDYKITQKRRIDNYGF